MKKRTIFIILITFSFSAFAKSSSGIYFSVFSNLVSTSFSSGSSSPTDKPYIKGLLSGTYSIYKDNALEFNISLFTNKYLHSADKYLSDYALGFEFGKLFSFNITTSNGKRIIAPDLSAGAYFKMDMLKPESSLKLYYSYGLYLGAKFKFPLKKKKIDSIDIGYKLHFPIFFSFQNDDSITTITNSHTLFVGISI